MTIPTEEERLAMRTALKPSVTVMRARLAGSLLQRAINILHDKYEVNPDDERNSHIVLYEKIAEALSNDSFATDKSVKQGLRDEFKKHFVPSNLRDKIGYDLYNITDRAITVARHVYGNTDGASNLINLIAHTHGFVSLHVSSYARNDIHAQITECIFHLGYEGMLEGEGQ